MPGYAVYILASPSRTLYIGMTNDLESRIWQHKNKAFPGFTSKYGVDRLVWFETFANVDDAIACERRLKGWRRERKIALIAEKNPGWYDLSRSWHEG
jgi:putative endonuclease